MENKKQQIQENILQFPIQTNLQSSFFSVFQWNVLAEKLCDETAFPKVNKNILPFSYRINLIKKYLEQYSPDILTLEEIDRPLDFENMLSKGIEYDTAFYPKIDKGKEKDGIFIGIKKSKFQIIKKFEKINYIDEKDGQQMTQFFVYGQVSLKQQNNEQNKQNILHVIATHLKAKEPFEDIRIKQTKYLSDFINKNIKPGSKIIVNGDFNTEFDKQSIQQLQQNVLKNSQSTQNFSDQIDLQDAFSEQNQGGQKDLISTYKIRDKPYIRKIDYIFFNNNTLQIVATNQLKNLRDEEKLKPGFPSDVFPSDHLFLYAVFGLKVNEQK